MLPMVERKTNPLSYYPSIHQSLSWASCGLDTAEGPLSLIHMLGGGHFRSQGAEQGEGEKVWIEPEDNKLKDKIILAQWRIREG